MSSPIGKNISRIDVRDYVSKVEYKNEYVAGWKEKDLILIIHCYYKSNELIIWFNSKWKNSWFTNSIDFVSFLLSANQQIEKIFISITLICTQWGPNSTGFNHIAMNVFKFYISDSIHDRHCVVLLKRFGSCINF